jgi:hypothetical protein
MFLIQLDVTFRLRERERNSLHICWFQPHAALLVLKSPKRDAQGVTMLTPIVGDNVAGLCRIRGEARLR